MNINVEGSNKSLHEKENSQQKKNIRNFFKASQPSQISDESMIEDNPSIP